MRSLRLRLLLGAVIGISIALSLAGFMLVRLFDAHVRQRYAKELEDHLIQLVAAIEVDAAGKYVVGQELSEPEFRRPLSGHYWQVDREGQVVLRSRSLWDATLSLRSEMPARGISSSYEIEGPFRQRLIVVEQLVELPTPESSVLRIAVAGLSDVIDTPRREFASVVALSLLGLGFLLAAASWLQVGAGLAPLRNLRGRLEALHSGAAQRVEGEYPLEVTGLVDDLNRLVGTQAAEAERARGNAAKLGHGLKTPLAMLAAEARVLREKGDDATASAVESQIASMNSQIALALASARAIGARAAMGTRTDVRRLLERLVGVMRKLSDDGSIAWSIEIPDRLPPIRLDQRDVEDILGNVLDNARKWGRSRVAVDVSQLEGHVVIVVEDDGPGIPAESMDDVMLRGVRLDRSVPGTGVGLSIVKDLLELNNGALTMSARDGTGLRVEISLPAASRTER